MKPEITNVSFAIFDSSILNTNFSFEEIKNIEFIDITDNVLLENDILIRKINNEYNPLAATYFTHIVKLNPALFADYVKLNDLFKFEYEGFIFKIKTKIREDNIIDYYSNIVARVYVDCLNDDLILSFIGHSATNNIEIIN